MMSGKIATMYYKACVSVKFQLKHLARRMTLIDKKCKLETITNHSRTANNF